MAPTPAAVGGVLRQVIHYHIDNASYENALFFSERYIAQEPKSADATYLYALSHLRVGDARSAYDVSKTMGYRGAHVPCAWVFAQACLELERYKDGITALEKTRALWSQKSTLGKHSATARPGHPDAPTILCLLGKLWRGHDDSDKRRSVACFEESLKMNPFMWDAFTALCDMGVSIRVPNVFRPTEAVLHCFDQQTILPSTELKESTSSNSLDLAPRKHHHLRNVMPDPGSDPFSANFSSTEVSIQEANGEGADTDLMSKIQAARLRLASSTNSQPALDGMETPPTGTPTDSAASRPIHPHEPPQAPARKTRNAQGIDPNMEAPPRMNYKLGTRRTGRALEKGHDSSVEPMSDAPTTSTAPSIRPSILAAERKRTVSGHPVARPTTTDEAGMRRSARLNMFKPSAKANSGAATIGASAGRELKKARPQISRIVRPGSSGSNVGRVVSGNRKPLEDQNADVDQGEAPRAREANSHHPVLRTSELDAAKLEESLKWLLDIIKRLGNGYYQLSNFHCQEALQSFASLPLTQQNSPWVLAQMGRAHYEQASYSDAEKFFRKMRVQAPSRLQDMEVYSTVLWHLKRETDLSFLAHELVDAAWHSPQAWCALGNAWSLARDHEQALRCFKRATQLDPKFAYAFTLQGHEHVTNEEFDKALTAYRQAISADRRHYNAYYGIGRVQERLGAFDKAHAHFHAARCINPNNAVLICCIGTILEKQKQILPALQAYSKAVELAPKAAQTRYKKARALLAVGQVEAAQKELMILKDLAPDEGTVHFLLGSLYQKMDERQLAVRHFTIALALDPKAGPRIKQAIESLERDVPMDDSMMG
ncbi:hypothetical protein B0I35DRAFT_480079 [Stachybotrys elegans]|uniref:Anaphase-promoting complex subunit 3 n=1 Tax=Stachybotrys elegans TaxID=80388 RepID=A0A8K0SRR7_9HYPO|nr:hypothetical protein B0I35DRAFT_480079 [Stachybotrys elegans]